MQHDADPAVAAFGEGLPGLSERAKWEVMRHQARDVDLAVGEQGERTAGNSLWVRERAEDVEVAAHDGREIDARKLDSGAGRPAENDAAPAARQSDRIACGLGRTGELHDEIGPPS